MGKATRVRHWDVFCRVIDNFGDIGVCWRLCAELARRGERVRLWVDDASALAWMAPEGAAGVEPRHWPVDDPSAGAGAEPGNVVIEAFGCDPPPAFVAAMAKRDPAPLWLNLEYLSAEAYVERNHGLASPVSSGPGEGLVKHFWYPGFTPATGGLIRERGLPEQQRRFDRDGWLTGRGLPRREAERVVSLFCYEQPALDGLLNALADRPTLLLAADGHAARQIVALLGSDDHPVPRRSLHHRGELRAATLPALTQSDYDHLLWAADLNFVRGEDSAVRAQWAGRPFVWQLYPQADGVHAVKLHAFLDRFLGGADETTAATVRAIWDHWNGLPYNGLPSVSRTGANWPAWPAEPAWRERCAAWRDRLLELPELVTGLIARAGETG